MFLAKFNSKQLEKGDQEQTKMVMPQENMMRNDFIKWINRQILTTWIPTLIRDLIEARHRTEDARDRRTWRTWRPRKLDTGEIRSDCGHFVYKKQSTSTSDFKNLKTISLFFLAGPLI